ncbi:hypothetical protein ACQK5W_00530 [Pantoea sp. FN060301]|uniref:hypothetical protein n=1 Tax=Pantoea sp. FN060301 TaxID=3420380 RepID=UPI003D172642
MKWTVTDTVACPSTGTFFSRIVSERKLYLILWYSSEYIIEKDNVITTGVRHVNKNGKPFELDLLKILPGNDQMWHLLKRNNDCPGNTDFISEKCSRMTSCAFNVCPWGKEQRMLVR